MRSILNGMLNSLWCIYLGFIVTLITGYDGTSWQWWIICFPTFLLTLVDIKIKDPKDISKS